MSTRLESRLMQQQQQQQQQSVQCGEPVSLDQVVKMKKSSTFDLHGHQQVKDLYSKARRSKV